MRYSADNYLDALPGENGVYSNMNAGIAGTALATVDGRDYDTLVYDEILSA